MSFFNLVGIFSPILTVLVAAIGWIIAHRFNAHRDFENKKREIRLTYLLETYRKLESASNRSHESQFEGKKGDQASLALMNAMENALGEIQLLGSLEQINLAQKVAKEMADKKSTSLDDLLYDLRESLRIELKLDKAPRKLVFMRVCWH